MNVNVKGWQKQNWKKAVSISTCVFSLCVIRDLAPQLQALVKRMKNDPASLYILLATANRQPPSNPLLCILFSHILPPACIGASLVLTQHSFILKDACTAHLIYFLLIISVLLSPNENSQRSNLCNFFSFCFVCLQHYLIHRESILSWTGRWSPCLLEAMTFATTATTLWVPMWSNNPADNWFGLDWDTAMTNTDHYLFIFVCVFFNHCFAASLLCRDLCSHHSGKPGLLAQRGKKKTSIFSPLTPDYEN